MSKGKNPARKVIEQQISGIEQRLVDVRVEASTLQSKLEFLHEILSALPVDGRTIKGKVVGRIGAEPNGS